MSGLRNGEILIEDGTDPDMLFDPRVDGERKARGYVPRDYSEYPQEMFDPPSDMQLIPRSEWSERIKDLEANGSNLSSIRLRGNGGQIIPSLDQSREGFCWAYSTTGCVTLLRAVNNQPYVRLSGHAIGCMVMNFKNQGGWCGLSAKFHRERGCPSTKFWPEQSMSRANDNPQTWENAAGHRVTEDWVDLTRPVHGQVLTFDQVATCLLLGVPCALDFNWWGHSVCALDLVEVERGSFGLRILNSWSDAWGDRGMAVLRGQQAIPDGAVALRVTGASAA